MSLKAFIIVVNYNKNRNKTSWSLYVHSLGILNILRDREGRTYKKININLGVKTNPEPTEPLRKTHTLFQQMKNLGIKFQPLRPRGSRTLVVQTLKYILFVWLSSRNYFEYFNPEMKCFFDSILDIHIKKIL